MISHSSHPSTLTDPVTQPPLLPSQMHQSLQSNPSAVLRIHPARRNLKHLHDVASAETSQANTKYS